MSEKTFSHTAALEKFRKLLFVGFSSVGFGAAAYLFLSALWLVQTGGSY